jgi:integrase
MSILGTEKTWERTWQVIYKRGKRYIYDFLLDGIRYQGSTRLENRRAAENYEAALRTKIINKEVGLIEKPRHSVGTLLDGLERRWSVEEKLSPQNVSLIKVTRADWATKKADELTAKDLEDYVVKRRNLGYAISTTNRVLQALRRAFNLGGVPWPKFELPKEENTREGIATPGQVEKLLACLPDDGLRDFIQFLYATGMRRGQAAKIKWEYVQAGTIAIPGPICKSRKPHVIPISGPLVGVIERRKTARPFNTNGTTGLSEYVFHRGDGLPILEFRKSWKSATRAAGVGNLLPHDLRRSGCSDMIRAGVPQSVAMKISGHKTASMFLRYNIVSNEDTSAALEKTAAYRSKLA